MNVSSTSTESVIEFICKRSAQEPDVSRVVLFGSRANHTDHARSDYDLAIDAPQMTDIAWARFAIDLTENVPTLCGLDLIRIRPDMNPELAKKILTEGKEIYVRSTIR